MREDYSEGGTLPTLALVIGADALGPHQALASSLPYLYFLFVFLTVLNLNGRLCAFSGLVAGVQFAVVSVVLLGVTSNQAATAATGATMLVDPRQCVVKGLLLGLTGLLAGFVARRIRHQVEQARRALEEHHDAGARSGLVCGCARTGEMIHLPHSPPPDDEPRHAPDDQRPESRQVERRENGRDTEAEGLALGERRRRSAKPVTPHHEPTTRGCRNLVMTGQELLWGIARERGAQTTTT